jgi:Na+-transporting methylmalonyl-CoA/oxaloacetate decarboxylase gamma subunit
MKRLMVFMVGFVFLFSLVVMAADQVSASITKTDSAKEKVAKRQKTGTVVNLSDEAIKIEFTKKGKKETMEFALTKPAKVSLGEKVTVYYTEKDGKKEALNIKVKKASAKKSTKTKTISKN